MAIKQRGVDVEKVYKLVETADVKSSAGSSLNLEE